MSNGECDKLTPAHPAAANQSKYRLLAVSLWSWVLQLGGAGKKVKLIVQFRFLYPHKQGQENGI
jgi:hypothetical protein